MEMRITERRKGRTDGWRDSCVAAESVHYVAMVAVVVSPISEWGSPSCAG